MGGLGTIASIDTGHLFEKAAHWSSWGIPDVPSVSQVIIHRDVEHIICLVKAGLIIVILGKDEPVAMRVSFLLIRANGETPCTNVA